MYIFWNKYWRWGCLLQPIRLSCVQVRQFTCTMGTILKIMYFFVWVLCFTHFSLRTQHILQSSFCLFFLRSSLLGFLLFGKKEIILLNARNGAFLNTWNWKEWVGQENDDGENTFVRHLNIWAQHSCAGWFPVLSQLSTLPCLLVQRDVAHVAYITTHMKWEFHSQEFSTLSRRRLYVTF